MEAKNKEQKKRAKSKKIEICRYYVNGIHKLQSLFQTSSLSTSADLF